jgi:hemolysin III
MTDKAMITSEDSNEIFNSASHIIGALLAIAGLVILITFSAIQGSPIKVVSFSIYGSTLIASFLFSSLLHSFLIFKRYKKTLAILDHAAIYLLIAGTYTPFCLVGLGGALGWTTFGIIWGLAIISIALKTIFFDRLSNIFSIISYLLMGWLCLMMIYPLYIRFGLTAILLMGAAGFCFTFGFIIFLKKKPNPFPPIFGSHEIWHVFVLLGNIIFFFVMLIYLLF